jgi:hypothetical protein
MKCDGSLTEAIQISWEKKANGKDQRGQVGQSKCLASITF